MNIYSKTTSGEEARLLFGAKQQTPAKTTYRIFGARVWTTNHNNKNKTKQSWLNFFKNFFKSINNYSEESKLGFTGWKSNLNKSTQSDRFSYEYSTESIETATLKFSWKARKWVKTDVTTLPTTRTLSILGHTIFGNAQ